MSSPNTTKTKEDKTLFEVHTEIREELESIKSEIEEKCKNTSLRPEMRERYDWYIEQISILSGYILYASNKCKEDKTPLSKYKKVVPELTDYLLQIVDGIKRGINIIETAHLDKTPGEIGDKLLSEASNTVMHHIIGVARGIEDGTEDSTEIVTASSYLFYNRCTALSIIMAVNNLKEELEEVVIDHCSPVLNKICKDVVRGIDGYTEPLCDMLEGLNMDAPIDFLTFCYENLKVVKGVISSIRPFLNQYYRIEQTPEGERYLVEFKSAPPNASIETQSTDTTSKSTDTETHKKETISQRLDTATQNTNTALKEFREVQGAIKQNSIRASKDLVRSHFESIGDVMVVGTESQKKRVVKLQSQGKLLSGTLEGLSGGSPYFKAFSIALAKILNEQVVYYNTQDKGWRGLPEDLTRKILGENAKLESDTENKTLPEKRGRESTEINEEKRPFPYVIVSYKRLAEEMSKDGKISGGKDIEFIKRYINGGYREYTKDPKTKNRVPVKNTYEPGLVTKKYIIAKKDGTFILVPFIVNEAEITDNTGREIGCLLRLSPHYSMGVKLNYTSFRPDTIQLIGGGRQTEITMDLLELLLFSRGTGSTFRMSKNKFLEKYKNKKKYERRPKDLENDFKEAVQKAIDAKILVPGKKRGGGLKGYSEQVRDSVRGKIDCVFTYNPDYATGGDNLDINLDNQ